MGGKRYAGTTQRFWVKVDTAGPCPDHDPSLGACWIWTAGKTPGGYGHFRHWAGDMVVAHRLAYEMLIGPVPDGLHIDHLCRVRACVNPAHLEPVPTKENTRRGLNGVLKTHCVNGHPLDEANTWNYRGHRVCKTCGRARRREYDRRTYAERYAKRKQSA